MVQEVENDDLEISLENARALEPQAAIDSVVEIPKPTADPRAARINPVRDRHCGRG